MLAIVYIKSMPFVKANGINIYYETHGDGIPLLMIAGYTQDSQCWKEYIHPFSKHFSVTVFDNRGAGQTEAPEDGYSIELFAQDTIALMDALGIESAHLMGHSMGTCICQRICIDHHDRVRKSVLCAPFAYLPPVTKYNFTQLLTLLESGVSKETVFRMHLPWLLSNRFISHEEKVEQFVKDYMANPYPQTIQGILGQGEALFDVDLRPDLGKIPHELLLLIGEEDILTPPSCAALIQERALSCKTHAFKEVGHLFNFELPEKVTKQALQFLLQ